MNMFNNNIILCYYILNRCVDEINYYYSSVYYTIYNKHTYRYYLYIQYTIYIILTAAIGNRSVWVLHNKSHAFQPFFTFTQN